MRAGRWRSDNCTHQPLPPATQDKKIRMKDKIFKKEIIEIINSLNDQSIASDTKRNNEEDNDTFFYLTGKSTGLRMAIMKLQRLIHSK